MRSLWMVRRGEREQGPYTSPQLRKLASAGRLRTTDLIRKQGCEKFVPADKVKGLFDAQPPQSLPEESERLKTKDIPVAEVIEVIDEELPIVLEAVPDEDESDENYQSYENSYDEYPVVDYLEYEVPASSLRRASSQGRARSSPRVARGESRRERSSARPAKRKASRASDSDDEDGPWQELIGGVASLAIGIGLFIYIGPHEVEITGWGVVTWLLMVLNQIGGRWAILAFFLLTAGVCFGSAIKKFAER